MTKSRPPLFLERQSYRRRRLVDTSRAIPVFGVLLFMVPMIWQKPADGASDLSARGIYVFSVWLALVVVTAVVSWRLQSRMRVRPDPGKPPERTRDSRNVL